MHWLIDVKRKHLMSNNLLSLKMPILNQLQKPKKTLIIFQTIYSKTSIYLIDFRGET